MFSHSADLYDLIYSKRKDYPAEAAAIAERLRREHPKASSVLDVACGTGEHARLLSQRHGFQVEGLDLDPAFVRIASAKLPGRRIHLGDMTDFRLDRTYDAVLCLFSSIGYAVTPEKTTRALAAFRRHLEPGGVVLVEPWLLPEIVRPGYVSTETAEGEGLTVCRMSHMEVEGRLSRIRFEYLVGRADGIRRFSEVHELGMLTVEEMLACFRDAGLDVEHDPAGISGRGLYTARAAREAP